ncbi:MAG: trypsin-like serine protease [Streptomycetaceae bacterium]|nr:trypsin-like serine protease [Streptomycetaceae bacterium]
MRVAAMSTVGVLAVAGLVQYAPEVLALAESKHHISEDAGPPTDWEKKGAYLSAEQAYPSVVRLLASDDSPLCSGSVVHSPGADIVITAAHCVYSDGTWNTGLSVSPGTTGGRNQHGTWNVDRIWVDPRYMQGDERYDYAFLRVSRPDGSEIEDVVGGNTLTVNEPFHLDKVTTTGYPNSNNPGDQQITCTMGTYQSGAHDQYREMRCGGYYGGVSGGPWVLLTPGAKTGALIGIIGGYNGGGPSDDDAHADAISYSPYFTEDTMSLYQQAVDDDGGQGAS